MRSVLDIPTTDPGRDAPVVSHLVDISDLLTEDEDETDYDNEGNITIRNKTKIHASEYFRRSGSLAAGEQANVMPPELIIRSANKVMTNL